MIPPTIPLFPLPNALLFPGVLLPLHVFEPRYRAMVADALAGDRVIGMVLLRPGYERDYEGRPPVYSIGCAGTITQAERLADGRYNLVLRGLNRFRITGEDHARSYRLAHIEILEERPDPAQQPVLAAQRDRLMAALAMLFSPPGGAAIAASVPDAELINGFAQDLDLEPLERQALLEQPDLLARCRALADLLEMRAYRPAGEQNRPSMH